MEDHNQTRETLQRLAERMQELAVLSHKINNPLTALMGRAQMLRLKQGTDPAACKSAEVIEESSRRVAEYVRELAQVVREVRVEALEGLGAEAETETTLT